MRFDFTRIWVKIKRRSVTILVTGVATAALTVATGFIQEKAGKILTVISGLVGILGAYLTFYARGNSNNLRRRDSLPLTHPVDPGQPAMDPRNSLEQSPPDPPRASYSSTSSDIASAIIPDTHESSSSQELVPLLTPDSDPTRFEEILALYSQAPIPYPTTHNSPYTLHKREGTFNNALEHLNHWCQLNDRRAIWTHERTGPDHQSEWESIVRVDEIRGIGRASQKQESKRKAAADFLTVIATK